MSSLICSQGLILATAMVVSSTVIFLTFSRQKNLTPPKQTLRSCLSSGPASWEGKKRDKKKKKVQFAQNVKETNGNGEEYRKEQNKKLIARRSSKVDRFCRNEMPPNRIALYNGILRDRVHRMECSY